MLIGSWFAERSANFIQCCQERIQRLPLQYSALFTLRQTCVYLNWWRFKFNYLCDFQIWQGVEPRDGASTCKNFVLTGNPAGFGIECFHMTSRRPYWCPKTVKRRPCWCPKPILWELNSFLMQTLSFVPINLHRCWPREWKHSIPFRHLNDPFPKHENK